MDEKGEKKMGNIKLINNIIKILEENWDLKLQSNYEKYEIGQQRVCGTC